MTSADATIRGFYAVMPAGGPGTRLWPLSRTDRPKFLLDLTGTGRSLIQQTWDRLNQITATGRMVVVTGAPHVAAVTAHLPGLDPANLFCEPSSRDTAAAICLAAAVIGRRDPAAVIGSFPADHVIQDVAAFHGAVREAVATAREGYVVTIGIDPTHPSTGFGYIQLGGPLAVPGAPAATAVVRFVEKPDAATAARYLAEGMWRWNAGMFIARTDVLLTELERNRPALHAGIREIADAWDTPRRAEVLSAVWPTLEKISIDHAVAEPMALSGRVAVVPAALGWDDIGDWASLVNLLSADSDAAPAVLGEAARVLCTNSTGLVVAEGGRRVQVHDLTDVVVVDTPDVLLVISKERAQEVKHLVAELKRRGQVNLI